MKENKNDKNDRKEYYLNQNLITWCAGMFALYIHSKYGVGCVFYSLGLIVGVAATISLVVCLVAYTVFYCRKRIGGRNG